MFSDKSVESSREVIIEPTQIGMVVKEYYFFDKMRRGVVQYTVY